MLLQPVYAVLQQSTPAHEAKATDTVETSVTNGSADDAIDNAKDDDNSTADESPSAPADEDCSEALDEAVTSAMVACNQRVTADVIRQLSLLLVDSWVKLATQLHFQEDDISYFQSVNSTPAARTTNMLTVWAVSTLLFMHISTISLSSQPHNWVVFSILHLFSGYQQAIVL